MRAGVPSMSRLMVWIPCALVSGAHRLGHGDRHLAQRQSSIRGALQGGDLVLELHPDLKIGDRASAGAESLLTKA
jgi:hypothetical protein